MEFSIIPDKDALAACAWCNGPISEHMEVFSLDCRFAPDTDLSDYESHCVRVGLVSEDKLVNMMVTARGSEAKQLGKDGMFLLCSQDCAEKLKSALVKDIKLGSLFSEVL